MSDLIRISSSVLPDTARVIAFRGFEAISRPYEHEIFISVEGDEGDAIDLQDAVGAKAQLIIDRTDDRLPPYIFSGIFAGIDLLHAVSGRSLLRAVLVPRLWLLGLTKHSRIFTNKSLPDIIKDVLADNSLGSDDFKLQLGSYDPEEHVCQYRESDLDFLSRWMEREGIYYFFEHDEGGEKIVFRDDLSYEQDPIGAPVRYHPQLGGDVSAGASFRAFIVRNRTLPATVTLRDYDYGRPNLNVTGAADVASNGAGEVNEYGDRFFTPASGKRLAKIRAEELLARRVVFHGQGTRTHLRSGYTFEVEDHPRADLNTRYLATAVRHWGNQASGASHFKSLIDLSHEEVYYVEVDAMAADIQFRAENRTPWPRIYGFENAKVDGPAESEYAQIDEHGRYKIKLKFDESKLKGGKASTFVRMMQPHGGAPEGFHFPLRKGTEVMVSFLGGDPDRPFISGVVPNALTPSPVIDSNHTKNVIQTGGQNRFEMEDTDGSQYIDVSSPPEKTHLHMGAHHGPHKHNWILSTDGNGLVHTGADRNITVGGEQTEDVTGNLTEDYHSNQTTHVFAAFDETIDGGAKQTISAGSTQTITGGATQSIDGGETRTVTGGMTETIDGGRTQTITGGSTETVNGDVTQTVNGSVTQTISGGVTETVNGAISQSVVGGVSITTPSTYKITATGGMQIVATGGWQLIAPGGTTTVDSFFDKTGGKYLDAFGFKLSVLGAKVEIVPGLAFSYTAIKIDVAQLKVDIAMAKYANKPIELKTIGQVIQAGYLALHGVAFCMIT
jgi:type VI secretion system secreted protein VgrG